MSKEIEEKRAKRKADAEAARAEQYEKDLEALDKLEEEHGDNRVAALEVRGYVKGLPTLVVVKSPGKFYKRYTDKVRKAAGKNATAVGEAQDELGEACIVYPSEPDVRKAMFAEFTGTLVSAAMRAIEFAELEADNEKKG